MADASPIRRQGAKERSQRGRRENSRASIICRTCGKCRSKKVRCDGTRPSCGSCLASSNVCIYPPDERRLARPTKAEIEALQIEVATFRNILSNQGGEHSTGNVPSASPGFVPAGEVIGLDFVAQEVSQRYNNPPAAPPEGTEPRNTPRNSYQGSPKNKDGDGSAGPSPFEAEIACAIEEDGSIHIHGPTSHLHQPSTTRHASPEIPISESEQELQTQIIKDQLFAYAALQRQRESTILLSGPARQLGSLADLDGVSIDLAAHLLDLHWNRQHFAYLLTYRPAIIDSLMNNGPYCNKLLLNSIYYSSCLYSDRSVFRASPDDPESMGGDFYIRFKQLLMDEIDRPSLPTIAALLICGSTLVSNGKQSAGWSLCGLAYRMVIDLGCHLSISPRKDRSFATSRLTAIEIEMRTRIYWGAFLTDKFQSLYLGRQPALRPSEARVSRTLFDHHEELENWMPYVDPVSTPTSTHLAGFVGPRPVYAITTLQALIPLGDIASTIASTFYAIDSIQTPRAVLLEAKKKTQSRLDVWRIELPQHLQFDPVKDPTPPPNQITPHATYHTLVILLERPFLTNGHLSFASETSSQVEGEAKCREAAFRIWRLVDAYKNAFTLRRAPYFLSYATYSAIVVILHQSDIDNPQLVECIRFFWFALLDFQKGCTSGLRKPLQILRTLMQRLGQNVPHGDPNERMVHVSAASGAVSNAVQADFTNDQVPDLFASFGYAEGSILDDLLQQNNGIGPWENFNWMDSMSNNQGLMDDSLFGLFSPGQPSFQAFENNF